MPEVHFPFVLEQGNGKRYQQLIDHIKQGILSGRWAAGDWLPSSRQLATAVGVSRTTTSRAYDHLIAEGFLVSEPKRGVRVADTRWATELTKHTVPNSRRVPKASPHRLPVAQLLRCDSGADSSVFPARHWAASMRRAWIKPDARLLEGRYNTGYPPLKVAIAEYLQRSCGLDCVAEQILVTAGNRDALVLLQHALEGVIPNAQWWIEDPSYMPMRTLLQQRRNGVQLLSVDEEGALLPAGSDQPQVALITPNRQYPLGMSMSSMRRQAWLQSLQTESRWLVEDNYDTEFTYHGRPQFPLMQADHQGRIVLVGSFSKVLFRGLRLGYMVVPTAWIERMAKSQQALGASAALPVQPVLADFMLSGAFDRHLNRMRRHYREKRDALVQLVHEHLSPWVDWHLPAGGMHVPVSIKPLWMAQRQEQHDNTPWDLRIARHLLAQGIELNVLSAHYHNQSASRQGFILGFSQPSHADMTRIIRALAEQFAELEA